MLANANQGRSPFLELCEHHFFIVNVKIHVLIQ